MGPFVLIITSACNSLLTDSVPSNHSLSWCLAPQHCSLIRITWTVMPQGWLHLYYQLYLSVLFSSEKQLSLSLSIGVISFLQGQDTAVQSGSSRPAGCSSSHLFINQPLQCFSFTTISQVSDQRTTLYISMDTIAVVFFCFLFRNWSQVNVPVRCVLFKSQESQVLINLWACPNPVQLSLRFQTWSVKLWNNQRCLS